MADDPERDLLPVKEGAPYERKIVSSCSVDCDRDVYAPYISKLDRKALEDRYMSLLLDNNRLKKESRRQEEKIKSMFQNQSTSLCLKEKQISNPKGRSSCGCHTKKQIADVPQCQIITDVQIDSDDLQQKEQLSQEVMRLNADIRILEQEMIAQRDQSRMRIGELEESLAHCMANDKRQKVAENVEMIRLRRSLQQQSAQMAANAAKIQVLEKEVEQLQQELLASQQENDELQGEICKERQKIVDIHENLQGAESDRLSIRELEEQIRDLQKEKAELKDHNERLLSLMSSKQKQNLEQEGALRTQVSQLEGMLSHQNCECARLKQQLEIAKQMAVQSQNTQEKDKDIQSQVKQLESELAAERKEKSNLMQLLNDMQSLVTKLKHKVVEESTDKENHLRSQVMTLENKLSTMLKERMEADRNLEKEQAKVEALERTQTDLCNKLKYLEAQQSKSQKQLDIDEKQCVCPEPRIPSLEESRSARGKRKLSFTSDVPISSDISDEMKEFDTSHTMESNTEASEVTSEKGIDSGTKSEETLVSEENEELSENNEDFSKKSENSQLSNISERTDESISEESEKSSIKKDEEKLKREIIEEIIQSIVTESIYEADESLRIDSEEISSMAAVPGDSRNKDCMSETADKIDICRELEKCRELLRVQYNLNCLYKKEVANLALRLNEKQVEKAKKEDKKSEQEEKETDKSMSPSHLVPPGIEEEPPGRLTIKHGEGVFEIHIQSMQLFPESFQNLTCKPSPSEVPGLFLTWIFYNQDVAYTPVKKIEYDIEFDSSSVYRVNLNEEFLDYLAEGECTVEVHMTVDDASEPIGKGKIDFSELLEFPQNKIHTSVSVFGINKQQPTAFFGVIQCWYRLSCSVQIINDFAHKKNVAGYQKTNEKNSDIRKLSSESNSVTQSDTDLHFGKSGEFTKLMHAHKGVLITEDEQPSSESLFLQGDSSIHIVEPARTYNGSSTQMIDTLGQKEVTSDNETQAPVAYEESENQSVAEESIPEEIESPEIDESSKEERSNESIPEEIVQEKKPTLSYKDYDSDSTASDTTEELSEDRIAVTVGALFLRERTYVMTDPTISHLYIQYEFLGYSGSELESPNSLPKPTVKPYVLMFKFRKVFPVDPEENSTQRSLLYDLIKHDSKNSNIHFTVVSEPLEDETSSLDVQTIGYADLNLLEVLHKAKSDVYKELIPVRSSKEDEDIAVLSVIIEGLNLMREMLV